MNCPFSCMTQLAGYCPIATTLPTEGQLNIVQPEGKSTFRNLSENAGNLPVRSPLPTKQNCFLPKNFPVHIIQYCIIEPIHIFYVSTIQIHCIIQKILWNILVTKKDICHSVRVIPIFSSLFFV